MSFKQIVQVTHLFLRETTVGLILNYTHFDLFRNWIPSVL